MNVNYPTISQNCILPLRLTLTVHTLSSASADFRGKFTAVIAGFSAQVDILASETYYYHSAAEG